MATECFPRGAPHLCTTEICCIGYAGERYGITWAMHPEMALKLAFDAGGVDGAWPDQHWTMAEFELIVRGADEQNVATDHKVRCLRMLITGRCDLWEELQDGGP